MSKVVLLFPGTAAGVDDQTREVIILVISQEILIFHLVETDRVAVLHI